MSCSRRRASRRSRVSGAVGLAQRGAGEELVGQGLAVVIRVEELVQVEDEGSEDRRHLGGARRIGETQLHAVDVPIVAVEGDLELGVIRDFHQVFPRLQERKPAAQRAGFIRRSH